MSEVVDFFSRKGITPVVALPSERKTTLMSVFKALRGEIEAADAEMLKALNETAHILHVAALYYGGMGKPCGQTFRDIAVILDEEIADLKVLS